MKRNRFLLCIFCVCGLTMFSVEAQSQFLISAYRKLQLKRLLKDTTTLAYKDSTRLKLLQAELDYINEAEEQAAKACTPKFGLAYESEISNSQETIENLKVTGIQGKVGIREQVKANELVEKYCDYLAAYAQGISEYRFLIEDMFGSNRNIVYNDLDAGNNNIELSGYLNDVTSHRPAISYGSVPPRKKWEYIADDGQGSQLLVIEVLKKINRLKTTNIFYVRIKAHPTTGEKIVSIANIFKVRSSQFQAPYIIY
ncbi:MAG: hypothetical protein AB2L20_12410 [Mangrovibacterium sp.]